jgi:CubicO group peptidase (beta-lactamase class C family)
MFRIASLPKPITSAAIFTLVEAVNLRTGDRVS